MKRKRRKKRVCSVQTYSDPVISCLLFQTRNGQLVRKKPRDPRVRSKPLGGAFRDTTNSCANYKECVCTIAPQASPETPQSLSDRPYNIRVLKDRLRKSKYRAADP